MVSLAFMVINVFTKTAQAYTIFCQTSYVSRLLLQSGPDKKIRHFQCKRCRALFAIFVTLY